MNHNLENPDLSCAVRGSCRSLLIKHRKDDTKTSSPVASHDNPGTHVLTRNQSVCQCRICEIAKPNDYVA